ncbi:MAG: winged helix-turn-helix domain-containing protein [candidate division NC10 bacterium]|nr:winged helix-turn-helix domain-containing protein [candidate division NC10 bacterium]
MSPQHQLLLMALGWLARENKLNFVQDRRSLKLSLKADWADVKMKPLALYAQVRHQTAPRGQRRDRLSEVHFI